MDLLDPLSDITSEMTQGKAPQPWKMKIPEVLGDAWLHLVMCLVLGVISDYGKASEELKACKRAVSRGREEILQGLAPDPMLEREAALPLGVASLIVQNLVNHGVPRQPDVFSTYSEYLDQLVRRARFECFKNGGR